MQLALAPRYLASLGALAVQLRMELEHVRVVHEQMGARDGCQVDNHRTGRHGGLVVQRDAREAVSMLKLTIAVEMFSTNWPPAFLNDRP